MNPDIGIRFIYRNVFVVILFLTLNSCQEFSLQQVEAISIPVDDNIEDDNIEDDKHINEIIQPFKDSLSQTMNQIIGYSSMEMRKGFPEGLLGNFVTNLMMEMTNKQHHKEVDFAFTNNGGLRTFLPQGNIYLRTVYELMPFENEIIILNLDYDHMLKLLDYIAIGKGLAVSGLRLEIENDKVTQATINNLEINRKEAYRVVTIDYLANGGSGMSFLEDIENRELIGVRLRDMILDYIKMKQYINEPLSAELDERIKINE